MSESIVNILRPIFYIEFGNLEKVTESLCHPGPYPAGSNGIFLSVVRGVSRLSAPRHNVLVWLHIPYGRRTQSPGRGGLIPFHESERPNFLQSKYFAQVTPQKCGFFILKRSSSRNSSIRNRHHHMPFFRTRGAMKRSHSKTCGSTSRV